MGEPVVGICLDANGTPIPWPVALTGEELSTLAAALRAYARMRSERGQSLTPIERGLVRRFAEQDWVLRIQLCESDLGRPCPAT